MNWSLICIHLQTRLTRKQFQIGFYHCKLTQEMKLTWTAVSLWLLRNFNFIALSWKLRLWWFWFIYVHDLNLSICQVEIGFSSGLSTTSIFTLLSKDHVWRSVCFSAGELYGFHGSRSSQFPPDDNGVQGILFYAIY